LQGWVELNLAKKKKTQFPKSYLEKQSQQIPGMYPEKRETLMVEQRDERKKEKQLCEEE